MAEIEFDDQVLLDLVRLLSAEDRLALFNALFDSPGLGFTRSKARKAEIIGKMIDISKNNVYPYLSSKRIPNPDTTVQIVKALLRQSYGTGTVRPFLRRAAGRMLNDLRLFSDWEKPFVRQESRLADEMNPISNRTIDRLERSLRW